MVDDGVGLRVSQLIALAGALVGQGPGDMAPAAAWLAACDPCTGPMVSTGCRRRAICVERRRDRARESRRAKTEQADSPVSWAGADKELSGQASRWTAWVCKAGAGSRLICNRCKGRTIEVAAQVAQSPKALQGAGAGLCVAAAAHDVVGAAWPDSSLPANGTQ